MRCGSSVKNEGRMRRRRRDLSCSRPRVFERKRREKRFTAGVTTWRASITKGVHNAGKGKGEGEGRKRTNCGRMYVIALHRV
jgi:hypothetical protein